MTDLPPILETLIDSLTEKERVQAAKAILKGTGHLVGPWVPMKEHVNTMEHCGVERIDGFRGYRYLLSMADPENYADIAHKTMLEDN